MEGIVVHHASDFLQFFFIHVLTLAQNLCEAEDDVQRGAYLVRHVLNEYVLLADTFLGHLHRRHQLFVTPFGLLRGLLDAADTLFDRLLHGGKAVLQLSDGVLARGAGYLQVVVSFRDLL